MTYPTGVSVIMLAKGSFCGRDRRGVRALTGIIALNELRRRLRDRSVLITAIVAPLAIAAILGFAFANRPPTGPLPIGVSGASPAVVRAAAHAAQLPPNVTVRPREHAEPSRSARWPTAPWPAGSWPTAGTRAWATC